jgi:2-hydroxy-6-oxonona-2,4-dienedioate hydrolase
MTIWTELIGAETQFVEHGYRTRVISAGSGIPLVLLHGQGGHAENFRHNIPAYSERYRVIAPDFVWHGLSSSPKQHGGLIEQMEAQVSSLLDHLGVKQCFIEGQSMGGWVAARLAITRPELVAGLILTTPMGINPTGAPIDSAQLDRVRAAQFTALDEQDVGATRTRMKRLFRDQAALDEEIVELRTALYRDNKRNAALRGVATRYFDSAYVAEAELTAQDLRSIKAPTLVYWGTRNSTPPSLGQHIANLVPRGQFHCADVGHWAQYEGWAEHNDVCMKFLASLGEPGRQ